MSWRWRLAAVADRRPPRRAGWRGRSGEVRRLGGGGAGVRVAVPAGGGLAAALMAAGYLVFAAAAASRPARPAGGSPGPGVAGTAELRRPGGRHDRAAGRAGAAAAPVVASQAEHRSSPAARRRHAGAPCGQAPRMTTPVLDLAVGSALVLDGAEWTVEQLQPQYGTVVLTRGDGQRMRVSVRFLISHPHCRPSTRSAAEAADRGRQPKTVQDLSPHKRELAHLRLAHLLEAATGFRSGDPSRPQPGSRNRSTTRPRRR